MRTKTLTLLTWGLTLLGVPASTQTLDTSEEAIPITDPALLEDLGFDADATDVYATEQVLRHMAMSPEEREAAQGNPFDNPEGSPAGGPYGTSAWGYTPVIGTEFFPIRAGTWGFGIMGRNCIDGPRIYRAQIHGLPHGADLRQLSVWLYDDHGDDIAVALVRSCLSDGPGGPSYVALRSASTSGTGGHQFLNLGCIPPPGSICVPGTMLHETIDLQSCSYWVNVGLGAPGPSCTGGADLAIHAARARWRRQVSPPPSTATFGDVPPDHLFFRHIEALAASGITGGCGNGDFCPGAPLTRAQMAAFLAKALGLHWGEVSQ